MLEEVEKHDLGSTQRNSLSVRMENVVRNIVKEKTKEVDDIIYKIRTWLKDETTELSDIEIDDILLLLPILLYDNMEEQEIIGVQSDMANQIYKEAQSQAYTIARGTVAERNSVADMRTRAEQLEKVIFERAYKIIKQKFELAIETLNAVKKVQAARQQRNELGNFKGRF